MMNTNICNHKTTSMWGVCVCVCEGGGVFVDIFGDNMSNLIPLLYQLKLVKVINALHLN